MGNGQQQQQQQRVLASDVLIEKECMDGLVGIVSGALVLTRFLGGISF